MLGVDSWAPYGVFKPKFIFSIGRGIETPLSLDYCTINKSRGFFAMILVNLDMSSKLPNQLLVERPRSAFVAEVECERLPPSYSACKMIGHAFSNCKK